MVCEKGHFYKEEKYDECPVCKSIKMSMGIEPVKESDEKIPQRGLRSFLKPKSDAQKAGKVAAEPIDGEKTVLLDTLEEKTVLLDTEEEKTVLLDTGEAIVQDEERTVNLTKPSGIKLVCVAGSMRGAEYELYDEEIVRIGDSDFVVKISKS